MLNIFDLAKSEYEASKSKNLRGVDSETTAEIFEDANGNSLREKHVLVCGSTSSGKSSLIARFLTSRNYSNENRIAMPSKTGKTIALEFAYALRNERSNKELAYLWDLGGGGSLANLLEIILTPDNIRDFSVILFLDLMHPEEYQSVVESIFAVLRKRIEEILGILKVCESPAFVEKLIRTSKTHFAEHKDATLVQPFEVPLAIIAGKYDLFQNIDSDRKRNVFRLLRYLAHINGATLLTMCNNMESLFAKTCSLLEHFAFGIGFNYKLYATSIHEPVFVGAGADSIESIDMPGNTYISSHHKAMSEWIRSLNEIFPNITQSLNSSSDSAVQEVEDKQFAESMIDELMESKARALELFIKKKRDRKAMQKKIKQRNVNLLFVEETF